MTEIVINGSNKIHCKYGELLKDVLEKNGFTFIGNCGGMGNCRSCTIYDETENRYIKSCKYSVTKDMVISFEEKKTDILLCESEHRTDECLEDDYGIAVDLGTTTIAIVLVHIATGKICETYSAYNPQIKLGADVISRISYGMTAKGLTKLRKLALNELFDGIKYVTKQGAYKPSSIVIAGNTTMLAIIEDFTLENLAAYPFSIKNLSRMSFDAFDIFKPIIEDIDNYSFLKGADFICLPNLSAFVGADALAGAYSIKLGQTGSYEMMIDLGTNGEMILYNGICGFATSCACGPAFESSIRCRNIQGANLFDMIAVLRKRNIIDCNGIMPEPYFTSGYKAANDMIIDMELLQSFMLAKAAIAAGIEALFIKSGIYSSDISKIYISGGFGFNLNIQNAIYLGMLPEDFAGKIVISGNTSLKGAVECLTDKGKIDGIDSFMKKIIPVNMAECEEYNKLFVDNIHF